MGLKLRETVSCIRTPEGILFRSVEIFLPVEGTGVAACFARLRPFLNGRWTVQQLCASLSEDQRLLITKLTDALLETGMLYDASQDDPDLLPEDRKQYLASFLARIESRNATPFRALAGALKSRLLLFGPAPFLETLLEAASEIGISVQAVCTRDWSPSWEERMRIKYTPVLHREELCSSAGLAGMISQLDTVVVSGEADLDLPWIRKISGLHCQLRRTPVVPLLFWGQRVIAGPVTKKAAAGCLGCLMICYADQPPSTASLAPVRRTASLHIGARLLMQRWLDVETEVLSEEDEAFFFELDCNTLQISLHPLLASTTCPSCSAGAAARYSASAEAPDEWPSDVFFASARKVLVDSRSGLIARMEEGDLVQLPFNQSAALWRVPGDRSRSIWTTETAENIRAARVAVIQRSLEEQLRRTATELDPSHPASIASLISRQSGAMPEGPYDRGIVVSAVGREQLAAEAFFRSLACHARHYGTWQEIRSFPRLVKAEEILVLHYLRDIGVFEKVRVSRCEDVSCGSCQVFQFVYDDRLVSVVSGMNEPTILATGLRDIWLHVTRDCLGPPPAEFLPEVRYRFAGDRAGISREANEICSALRLRLTLVQLDWPEVAFAAPLLFAYTLLASARATPDLAFHARVKDEVLIHESSGVNLNSGGPLP